MMKNRKQILTNIFGIFMIIGGVTHFVTPEMYGPFIPSFLPVNFVNMMAGVLEILLGIGLLIPQYNSRATLGLLVLMIAFLPLHIVDVFKEYPAIGTHEAALIRLPLQFILIIWAWFIHKK